MCILFHAASKCQHWLRQTVPGFYLKRRSYLENISSYFSFALRYALFFHLGISLEKKNSAVSCLFLSLITPCPYVGHKPPFLPWPLLLHCVVTWSWVMVEVPPTLCKTCRSVKFVTPHPVSVLMVSFLLKELKKYGVRTLVRVCDATYDQAPIEKEGIQVLVSCL